MNAQNAPNAEYCSSLRPLLATMTKTYAVTAATARPAPTANVPSGTAVRAFSMSFPERSLTDESRISLNIVAGPPTGPTRTRSPWPERRFSIAAVCAGFRVRRGARPREELPTAGRGRNPDESALRPARGEDGGMKTRTLMLLALVTGLAILAAGAIQILMAGR